MDNIWDNRTHLGQLENVSIDCICNSLRAMFNFLGAIMVFLLHQSMSFLLGDKAEVFRNGVLSTIYCHVVQQKGVCGGVGAVYREREEERLH